MISPLSYETVKTYRYVRISLIAAVILLFTALAIQITGSSGRMQGSISAYYYLPVRSVFVGTLVGASFSLVAIQGRPGGEDVLLNLAGMLLPLVAFIPTPVPGFSDAPCPRGDKCVPEEFIPGVEVSVGALILLGAAGLAFALWTLKAKGWSDPAAPKGLAAAGALWAVVAVSFGPTGDWGLRRWLIDVGHYAAAISVFALLVAVAFINAQRSEQGIRMAGRYASYKAIYRLVAAGMALGIIGACAYWFFVIRPVPEAQTTMIFWVEAWLLSLFAIFWGVQTKEFWREGLPIEAMRASASEVSPPGSTD